MIYLTRTRYDFGGRCARLGNQNFLDAQERDVTAGQIASFNMLSLARGWQTESVMKNLAFRSGLLSSIGEPPSSSKRSALDTTVRIERAKPPDIVELSKIVIFK